MNISLPLSKSSCIVWKSNSFDKWAFSHWAQRAERAVLLPEWLDWVHSTLWITFLIQSVISTNLTAASFSYPVILNMNFPLLISVLSLSATLSMWAQLKTHAHVWNQCDEIQVDVHRKCTCSHLNEIKLKIKTPFLGGIRYEVQVQVNQVWRLVT